MSQEQYAGIVAEQQKRKEDNSRQDNQVVHSEGTRKRRAHGHLGLQSAQRKQIKIDANYRPVGVEHDSSSSSDSLEADSAEVAPRVRMIRKDPQHLNPNYALGPPADSLFTYLLGYRGQQAFQSSNKEVLGLGVVAELGKPWQNGSDKSAAICSRLSAKFIEVRDKLREPWGRGHRDFGKRYLRPEFLLD